MLGPTNISSHKVGLANRGVLNLEVLYAQNGVEKNISGRRMFVLINSGAIKRRFFSFKLQATTNWLDKKFQRFRGNDHLESTFKVKYENLVVFF